MTHHLISCFRPPMCVCVCADVSLVVLTQRFLELMQEAPGGSVDLGQVAMRLKTRRRRVYDVTNVLGGINLVQKESASRIRWT